MHHPVFQEGMGIGLALVLELARLHSGEVTVRSTEGCGSQFSVSIRTGTAHLRLAGLRGRPPTPTPGHEAEFSAAADLRFPFDDGESGALPDESLPFKRCAAAGGSARILLAKDNADMRQYLLRLLSPHFEVEAVPDGRAALERAQMSRPDLVLTQTESQDTEFFYGTWNRWYFLRNRIPPGGGSAAFFQDIRERKAAEAVLVRNRERFDLVRELANIGFWFCDLPFDELLWDATVKEHFFLPADARVTIDLFYARTHPADRERTRQAIAASVGNQTRYDIEYRTTHPAGGENGSG